MDTLVAESFHNDPIVKKAKNDILSSLKKHQESIQSVRPPIKEKIQGYQETLKNFENIRGGSLWYPYLGSGMGKGALVELEDGSIKYDFINGIGAHPGHSLDIISEALMESSLQNTVMQGHLQQNTISFNLSKNLVESSQLDFCFLTSSGAMACENALKIIFQKKFPAKRLLAFEKCFMGRTLSMAQISDKAAYRQGLPLNMPIDYLPFYDPKNPQKSLDHTLEQIKKYLKRYPNKYAACCFELVQGEAGFYPGSKKFFKKVMQFLKEHDIAIFVDEVQTFGRTEELFAFQYFNLLEEVDVVTVGKLSQVCATLFKKDFKAGPGLISQTFTSSTSALHCAHAILEEFKRGNYHGKEGKISQIHRHFVKKLEDFSQKHPGLIEGPFGIGSMISFTAFQGDRGRTLRFLQDLFQAGVIAFVAGDAPMRVRFLLPIFAITKNDIDQAWEIIAQTLSKHDNV